MTEEASSAGEEIYELLAALYPICRSTSGDGVRRSFELVQTHLPGAGLVTSCLGDSEPNGRFLNTNSKREPQPGKRGLSRGVGGGSCADAAFLWVLNLSDGDHHRLTIAEHSGLPSADVADVADALRDTGLLNLAPAPD